MASRFRKSHEVLQKEIEIGRKLVKLSMAGDGKATHELLKAGASVNAEEYNRSLFYASKNYMTPLQVASNAGHQKCVQILISYGADLDAKDRFDVTSVHMAAENGHLQCLKLLLDAGADCNVATKYSKHGSYTAVPHVGGTTALHLATTNNHVMCVKELILNGSDYNAEDEMGRTSLYIAAHCGFDECVLTHLRNAIGRDILSLPVKDSGDTPLHECVRHGMLSCVTELLQHGSDVNHKNSTGFSPLHLAVQNGDKFNMEVVKELVLKGYNTDVNLPDGSGFTPLHYVSFSDCPKQERRACVASFLIAYGAQWDFIKNKHGHTLLQHELRILNTDKTILCAIAKSVKSLPSIESLGLLQNPQGHFRRQSSCKFSWYKSLTKEPRSLQHYCRCAIRQALGIRRLRHMEHLPLPTTMKEYLLLEYDEYR